VVGLRTGKTIASGCGGNSIGPELLLSIASLWEVAILQRLRRIELKVSITEIVARAESELSATLLGIEPLHIDKVRILPFHHRDPFDRLLIAQALILKAPIIAKDASFDAYGVQRIW
jgi:PIN domain nuclease of toxin-antitoxin system